MSVQAPLCRLQKDSSPGKRDAEEFIEVHRLSIPELRKLLRTGDVMLPTISTCYMALDMLQERGHDLS